MLVEVFNKVSWTPVHCRPSPPRQTRLRSSQEDETRLQGDRVRRDTNSIS